VHEVMEIEPEHIEPAPKIGTRLNTEFLRGMGKRDEEFIMILDIDRVFSADELSLVCQSSPGAADRCRKEEPREVCSPEIPG